MAIVTAHKGPQLAARVSFSAAWNVVIGILCIVYAVKDQDAECNVPHHRMVLDLSDFLLWFGVSHLVGVVCGLLALMVALPATGARVVGAAAIIIALAVVLFQLAWSVVGAVILFQDCLPCIGQQAAIGIVALVVIVLHWAVTPISLSLMITCNGDKDNDD